jgi:UDP-N-acetylglucosamine 2-epimerase
MRVLIVGAADGASLVEELEASGVAVERRADGAPPGDGREEIAEIARDLREFEGLLDDQGPDAVLIASDSPAALAAVLVATKAGVPCARLEASGATADEGANARVIRQLAEIALAPEAAAVVEWARDGYPARA